MKEAKLKSGSIKIDPEVLQDAKKLCKERGVQVSWFGTYAIKQLIDKIKKDKTWGLPK